MQWQHSPSPIPYPEALARMAERVAALQAGTGEEEIWLLEHPPLYTAGTSAKGQDLLESRGFPVYETGRGGQYTYHGPGQRIAYLTLNLGTRGKDIRAYVKSLEHWIIAALASFGVEAFLREERIGVWVNTPHGEAKIAALGVRVQRWVSSHGIAINVNPNLTHYQGIVPCGIRTFGVTSLADLGVNTSMEQLDAALKRTCPFE